MSVNFTGSAKIVYKSPKEFEQIIKGMKEVGAYPKYSFNDKVTSKLPMYSHSANTCSILAVNDTMVHLAPEPQFTGRDLFKKVSDFLKREKDEKGDITAILIGGKAKDSESWNLFTELGNLLEKYDADFTMLCGKNDKCKKGLDHLCKNGDTFIFTQEYNPHLEKAIKENTNLTSEGMENVLDNFYDVTWYMPKHEFIIDK